MAHHPAHTVIHQAGAWIEQRQVCDRCGHLLADNGEFGTTESGRRVPYPEGALVISTPFYQAMTLTDRLPTCTPSSAAQAGADLTNARAKGVSVGSETASIVEAPIASEGI